MLDQWPAVPVATADGFRLRGSGKLILMNSPVLRRITGTGFVLVAFAFGGGDFFTVTATALGGGGAGEAAAGLREKRALRPNFFLTAAVGLESGAGPAVTADFFAGETGAGDDLAACF